jgi:hypothetical protein
MEGAKLFNAGWSAAMRRVLIHAAALLSLATAIPARLPPDWQRARTLYYEGIAGNDGAIASAARLFTEMYREDANAPMIQVYYGSLRLLEASRTWALWKKNSLCKEGIRLMDQAVLAQPESLEIRFVRAATTYHLPAFFHRKEKAREDFAYLAHRAVSAAHEGRLEPRLAAASLYFNGELLNEAGCQECAIANWTRAISVAPNSPAARGAREKLAKAKR